MKKCDEILELLSLYIDNELDKEELNMVREHVKSCSSCKRELEQLSEVVKMCNDVDEIELPENFKDSLHQKLIYEQQNISDNKKIIVMRNRILKTISSVAAVLLIALVARGFLNMDKYSKQNGSIASSLKQESPIVSTSETGGKTNEKALAIMPQEKAKSEIAADSVSSTEARTEDDASSANSLENKSTFDEEKPPEEKTIIQANSDIASAAKTPGISSSHATPQPQATPTDNVETTVKFSGAVNPEDSAAVLAGGYSDNLANNIICLTMDSENIEADKVKLNDIAGKYGTIKEDENALNLQPPMNDSAVSKSEGFTRSGTNGYTVSYSMDKSNYDKFIKEVDTNFNGKYKISNSVELQFNGSEAAHQNVEVTITIYSK